MRALARIGFCLNIVFLAALHLGASDIRNLKALALKGDSEDQLAYAKSLVAFDSTDADSQEGVRWLKLSAAQGNKAAKLALARCMAIGHGLPLDYDKALTIIRSMAESGYADAQYELAQELIYGCKAPNTFLLKQDTKDPTDVEGVVWLRRAVESGHLKAHGSLAVCCMNGIGMKKNPEECFKLASFAAMRGDPNSQNALGALYAGGIGMDPDFKTAYVWFTILKSNPDSGWISESPLRQLRNYLTKADITECDARAVALKSQIEKITNGNR